MRRLSLHFVEPDILDYVCSIVEAKDTLKRVTAFITPTNLLIRLKSKVILFNELIYVCLGNESLLTMFSLMNLFLQCTRLHESLQFKATFNPWIQGVLSSVSHTPLMGYFILLGPWLNRLHTWKTA